MKKILIVSGHTDLNNSVANKNILKILKEELSDAEFDILSELYPNYIIDVKKEQEKLLNADIIILQYPMFWYSMPSLLERWMEEVFTHGLFIIIMVQQLCMQRVKQLRYKDLV